MDSYNCQHCLLSATQLVCQDVMDNSKKRTRTWCLCSVRTDSIGTKQNSQKNNTVSLYTHIPVSNHLHNIQFTTLITYHCVWSSVLCVVGWVAGRASSLWKRSYLQFYTTACYEK